jgi:KaiC/GvpD/RAD55 family RecA-like ATPase
MSEHPAAVAYLKKRGLWPLPDGTARFDDSEPDYPIALPLRDADGKIIGIERHAITDDGDPKILTAAGSVKKGATFGALSGDAGRVWMVEGFCDFVAGEGIAGRLGVEVLGIPGAGMAESAVEARVTQLREKTVFLSFDNDERGNDATQAAQRALERAGARPVIAKYPAGYKDLGEIVERLGLNAAGDVMAEVFAGAEKNLTRTWTVAQLYKASEIVLPPGIMEKRLLRPGSVGLVVGEGGIGKTRLCLALARCGAEGEPFGPFSVRKVRVAYLSEELNEAEMRALLLESFPAEQVDRMAGDVVVRCRSGFRSEKPEKIAEKVRAVLEEMGRPELVFIDALADLHDLNENDNREMGRLLRVLRDLVATPLGCTVVLVHHAGKPSEFVSGINLGRGASALRDVAADVLTVEWKQAKATSGPRIVSVVKRRNAPPLARLAVDLVEDPASHLVALEFLSTVEPEDDAAAAILRAAREHPGVQRDTLRELSGIGSARFRAALNRLVKDGKMRRTPIREGRTERVHYDPA